MFRKDVYFEVSKEKNAQYYIVVKNLEKNLQLTSYTFVMGGGEGEERKVNN